MEGQGRIDKTKAEEEEVNQGWIELAQEEEGKNRVRKRKTAQGEQVKVG